MALLTAANCPPPQPQQPAAWVYEMRGTADTSMAQVGVLFTGELALLAHHPGESSTEAGIALRASPPQRAPASPSQYYWMQESSLLAEYGVRSGVPGLQTGADVAIGVRRLSKTQRPGLPNDVGWAAIGEGRFWTMFEPQPMNHDFAIGPEATIGRRLDGNAMYLRLGLSANIHFR